MSSGLVPFGWFQVFRLGLVQMALGGIVVLTTSTINRVMVVELALPASLPGLLVGWHYAVQMSRPRWGHGADAGGRRGRWIIGGMIALALGALAASGSAALFAFNPMLGIGAAVVAFTIIGGGVGAAGTNLLALLAIRTPPDRKAAAAAIVWIMMIVGFVLTTGVAGGFLDPFSMGRLVTVTAVVGAIAVLLSIIALGDLAATSRGASDAVPASAKPDFWVTLKEVWADRQTRLFTTFIFVSMLAYSAQDLILEPFAGLLHGYSPGESTRLASMQNMGVLLGMITTAIIATLVGRSRALFMRKWALFGCAVSAAALGVLAMGSVATGDFPLVGAVFTLGIGNGLFAVAAIGSMMTLASAGGEGREGMRMGVWGASQAVAFALGGLAGATAIDLVRAGTADIGLSFAVVFSAEALTFILAGLLGLRVGTTDADHKSIPILPAEQWTAE